MAVGRIAAVPEGLRSPFLEGLSSVEQKSVLSSAKHRQYLANSVITNQDHPAEQFFLIIKGLARFFIMTDEGRKVLFRWIGPGDPCGGRAVLASRSTYLYSTETVMDSTVLVWDRATIRNLVERCPRLLENALLIVSDHVSWHVDSHIGFTCHTAKQRVAQVLTTLARTVGEKSRDGTILRITNEDLANAANVTPFTASRLMSEWQRERALVKRRGEVLLRSPERLFLSIV